MIALARPLLVAFLVAMLAPCASAKVVTVKLATFIPDGSPWHEILKDLGERWREVSDGQVRLKIYAGGVAGSELDVLRKMRIGSLHAAAFSSMGLAGVSDAPRALIIPRLIHTEDELRRVMEQVGPLIAKELEAEFFYHGMQPIVISEIVEMFTSSLNMFFNLFTAFLGAGLIIGVSALGIITLRSVHERRLEIGMMRAIGFKRRMVRRAFLLEATLIAVWGMLIGLLQGIYVGWYIWDEGFRELDYVFSIAWVRIGTVLIIAIIFILLCVQQL